jgi:uncharacterized protein (TIGR02646 family)
MKKIRKLSDFEGLSSYRQRYPTGEWGQFQQGDPEAYKTVQHQIFNDQRSLCAYCEIDLRLKAENYPRDFRVEHFHPKSDIATDHNWNLDWDNLLGVCHGGQNQVAGTDRYTHPDVSCDVPKADKNLDALILNPLTEIDSRIRIFGFNSYTGEIFVDHTCPASVTTKATQTIQELHLNANRLCTLRKSAIEQLEIEIGSLLGQGMADSVVFTRIANSQFPSDAHEILPAFFSSIRAYLGETAERRLREIAFDG